MIYTFYSPSRTTLPGTPPATVIPLDTRQALPFRRTFMSAHSSNRKPIDTRKRCQKYLGALLQQNYKTSRLFDFGALLQQKHTKDLRPPSGYYYRFRKPIERILQQKRESQADRTCKTARQFDFWRTSPTETLYKKGSHKYERFAPSLRTSLSIRKPIERIFGRLIQQKIIQESFTRNDIIYKSREILHFNTVLQRASRHHHSNIHTSLFRCLRQP